MSDEGSHFPTEDFLEWWESLHQAQRRNPAVRANPAVRIRLAASEAGLMLHGLNYIVRSYRVLQAGYFPPGSIPWYFQPHPFDRGKYDTKHVENILQLRTTLNALVGSGGRIRLDAFGIAAAILAVRVALRKVQPGELQGISTSSRKDAKKLLSKLEKYRKRAKRALITHFGKAACEEAGTR